MRIIGNFILFTLITVQASCYTLPPETSNKYPLLRLQEKYSVYLDSTWTTKDAAALLKVFEAIAPDLMNLQFSTWNISDDDLENGIQIEFKDKLKRVTVSRNIFPVEESQEISSPDKNLYYAVVQFITENGTNRSAIKLILKERYGISIDIPSYIELTEGVTDETAEHYSDFENEDLMIFISILEEFPQALHKTPQLKVCGS